MGALQAEGVEQAQGVLCQVAQGVGRSTRLVADRSAGVAVVVADDEPGAGRQTLAEAVLPPVHRGCPSHDEEDGGVGPIAECLHAEVDPVCPDDPLVGLHRPNLGTWRGRLLWGLGVVAVRHDGSFLNGCSIVQLEHTAIDLRSTINASPLQRECADTPQPLNFREDFSLLMMYPFGHHVLQDEIRIREGLTKHGRGLLDTLTARRDSRRGAMVYELGGAHLIYGVGVACALYFV